MLRKNAAALLTINGSNELVNLGGTLGNRYALMLAPLSLVQAIGSTTTLFVFAFGVGLSIFFPGVGRETLSLRELLQKGCRGTVRRRRRCPGGALTFILAGNPKLRDGLVEIIGEQRNTQQICRRAPVVGARRFGPQIAKVPDFAVATAKPGQRYEVDLLIDGHRVDHGCQLLHHRIVSVILQHGQVRIVRRIGGSRQGR